METKYKWMIGIGSVLAIGTTVYLLKPKKEVKAEAEKGAESSLEVKNTDPVKVATKPKFAVGKKITVSPSKVTANPTFSVMAGEGRGDGTVSPIVQAGDGRGTPIAVVVEQQLVVQAGEGRGVPAGTGRGFDGSSNFSGKLDLSNTKLMDI